MRLLMPIAIAFAFASTASAATYYVAPNGNDSANGSISAPFRTITKAAGVTRPGDVVQVRGGVYNEIVKASVKGTAAARITIEGYPGEKAVIDGTGTAANTDLVQLGSAEYLDFKGFEVRDSNRLGIAAWGAKNLRILNNVVTAAWRGGIYAGYDNFGSTHDITIDGNTVFSNVRMNETHNMSSGGWGQSISVQYADRVTITNNRVYQNDGEGIVIVASDNALVRGNEVSDSFSVGIYLDNAQSTTVDGNLVYSTGNSRYFRDGYPAAGIGTANESYSIQNPLSDNRITNNIVVDAKWGFYYGADEAGGGLKNTLVSNNTFHAARKAMLYIEADAHSGTVIQNNIFSQSGGGAMHSGTTAGIAFRHNNWYGGNAGAAAGAGDVIGDPRFVNAGGKRADDYKLGSISAAVHTATDLGGVNTDFWGNARTPTFDIGAHEASLALGSSSPSTPALESPASLRATVRADWIGLNWNEVAAAAAYQVYRNRSLVATTSTPEWSDTDFEPNSSYTYSVTAMDAYGTESAPSEAVTVRTAAAADTEAPGVPQNLNAIANGSARVVLTWEAVTARDLAGYAVYRNGVPVATVAATTWTDENVSAGTTYVYEVRSFDHALNHSAAAQATATTAGNQGRGRAVGRR